MSVPCQLSGLSWWQAALLLSAQWGVLQASTAFVLLNCKQTRTHHPSFARHCCELCCMCLQCSHTCACCHRLAAAMKREKYEQRHIGNFRRIYPSSSAAVQAKYERLLQGSARLFASSMKAKAYSTIGRIQVITDHLTFTIADHEIA